MPKSVANKASTKAAGKAKAKAKTKGNGKVKPAMKNTTGTTGKVGRPKKV